MKPATLGKDPVPSRDLVQSLQLLRLSLFRLCSAGRLVVSARHAIESAFLLFLALCATKYYLLFSFFTPVSSPPVVQEAKHSLVRLLPHSPPLNLSNLPEHFIIIRPSRRSAKLLMDGASE